MLFPQTAPTALFAQCLQERKLLLTVNYRLLSATEFSSNTVVPMPTCGGNLYQQKD